MDTYMNLRIASGCSVALPFCFLEQKDFNEKNANKKNLVKNIFFSIAHNFFANEGILDRTKVLESLARDLQICKESS